MSIDFDDFNIEAFKKIQSNAQQRIYQIDQQDWFQSTSLQPNSHHQNKNEKKQIPLFPINLDGEVELDLKSDYPHVNIIQNEALSNKIDYKPQIQVDQIFKKYQSKRFTQLKSKQLEQIKNFNLKSQTMRKEQSKFHQQNQRHNLFPQQQVHSLLKQDSQSVIQSRKLSVRVVSLFVAIHIAQLIYLILGKIVFFQPRIKIFDSQDQESMSSTAFFKIIIVIWILFHTFLLSSITIYSCALFFGKSLQNALAKKVFNENSMIQLTKNSVFISLSVTIARLVFLQYIGLILSLISIFMDLNMLKQAKKVVWQRKQFQRNCIRDCQNQSIQGEQNLNNQANQLMRDQLVR